MAATAVEMVSFDPESANLERRHLLICGGKPKKMALTAEGVLEPLDREHARAVGALHWLQTLTAYIPQLEAYNGYVREMLRTEPSANMRLDKDGACKTIVYPLATSGKCEASTTKRKDGLANFLGRMGQTPENYR